uniref:Uncharacterized protein n=1 Tax=Cannabis sativa TaxID=3483 RepID=A0A803R1F6_CANSA
MVISFIFSYVLTVFYLYSVFNLPCYFFVPCYLMPYIYFHILYSVLQILFYENCTESFNVLDFKDLAILKNWCN